MIIIIKTSMKVVGELSHKNMINNMLLHTMKRSLLLWLHNKWCLSQQKVLKVKWFGISSLF